MMRKIDENKVNIIGLSLVVISLVSFLEERFYFSDLLSSFRFQYVWMFLILFIINSVKKKIFLSSTYILFGFINGALIYPTWTDTLPLENQHLKIYYANILSSNDKYSQLIESISKYDPDIIVLLELNKRWEDKLNVLADNYKYQIMLSREDNFGMGVFSKFEFLNNKVLSGKAGVESILFQIKDKNKGLSILATHPLPPVSSEFWSLRNNQYNEIEKHLLDVKGDKILIGDFNVVPWSSYLKRLSQNTNLTMLNSFRDTWNSAFPMGMRIRLDHAFISKNLQGTIEILDNIGSDHLPMVLKIKYNK